MNDAKKQRKALGRGLMSLIPTTEETTSSVEENAASGERVVELLITSVRRNTRQPRTDFNDTDIHELAESIKNQGLLQPVVVRKLTDGYEIISGERRFRAIQSLGRDTVPCIIKKQVSDREMLEMALVENIQREDLNDIEKSLAYQALLQECGLSHEELSARIGKSRSVITNSLRLLKLPADVQLLIRDGSISMGHGRALLGLEGAAHQSTLAKRIVTDGLSVRDVEKLCGAKSEVKGKSQKNSTTEVKEKNTDPNMAEQVEKLRFHFGTSVDITSAKNGSGSLIINYYSMQDLNRILELIISQAS
jgi:ParB family chromosome partitioning protein